MSRTNCSRQRPKPPSAGGSPGRNAARRGHDRPPENHPHGHEARELLKQAPQVPSLVCNLAPLRIAATPLLSASSRNRCRKAHNPASAGSRVRILHVLPPDRPGGGQEVRGSEQPGRPPRTKSRSMAPDIARVSQRPGTQSHIGSPANDLVCALTSPPSLSPRQEVYASHWPCRPEGRQVTCPPASSSS